MIRRVEQPVVLASIVEGHGDVAAMPVLLSRLVRSLGVNAYFEIRPAQRVHKDRMIDPVAMGSYLNTAAAQIEGPGAIIIARDADDQAACILGPQILDVARSVRRDRDIIVAVFEREFEAAFVAAARSLGCNTGEAPSVRDAKGAVRRMLGRKYTETVDQAELVRLMDVEQACCVPSFARLRRKIGSIVTDEPQAQYL